jgi:hypothetical protein
MFVTALIMSLSQSVNRCRRPIPLWLKIAAALHFFVIVAGVNYFAPNSQFQADKTVPRQIEAIRDGMATTPRAGERMLRKTYLETSNEMPSVIAWGSSRGLAINADAVGTSSFINLSASYGTLFDLAAIYSILDRTNKMPKVLVAALDGWMLSDDVNIDKWNDYGDDVLRGLKLVNEAAQFKDRVKGFNAEVAQFEYDISYLTSPAIFSGNFFGALKRIKDARSLSALQLDVAVRPIDRKRDGWDRDLSYWYPCIPKNEVHDKAANWGTYRALPGEILLDGGFKQVDPQLVHLLRVLFLAFERRGVRILIFISPLHPVSFADMNLSPTRRATMDADRSFRKLGAEMHIPVFGSLDAAKVGLVDDDFCTDALHIRPDVAKRVLEYTGLTKIIANDLH